MTRLISELTARVVASIQRLVPSGVVVSQDSDHIIVDAGGGPNPIWFGDNVRGNLALGSSVEQSIEVAAQNVMQDLQDIMTINTGFAWPTTAGMPRDVFVSAHASVEGDVLEMWYGSRQEGRVASVSLVGLLPTRKDPGMSR